MDTFLFSHIRGVNMEIRYACKNDIPGILELLAQISRLHYEGRPDLFRLGRKFNYAEVEEMLRDPNKPTLVAVEDGNVRGYAICMYKELKDHPTLVDRKVMYIDDLCVDELCRGKGVGTALYEYVRNLAIETDCVNVELNVWSFNTSAIRFYEKCGMVPQRVIMESEKLQNNH